MIFTLFFSRVLQKKTCVWQRQSRACRSCHVVWHNRWCIAFLIQREPDTARPGEDPQRFAIPCPTGKGRQSPHCSTWEVYDWHDHSDATGGGFRTPRRCVSHISQKTTCILWHDTCDTWQHWLLNSRKIALRHKVVLKSRSLAHAIFWYGQEVCRNTWTSFPQEVGGPQTVLLQDAHQNMILNYGMCST